MSETDILIRVAETLLVGGIAFAVLGAVIAKAIGRETKGANVVMSFGWLAMAAAIVVFVFEAFFVTGTGGNTGPNCGPPNAPIVGQDC